jgi:hypothetical protein
MMTNGLAASPAPSHPPGVGAWGEEIDVVGPLQRQWTTCQSDRLEQLSVHPVYETLLSKLETGRHFTISFGYLLLAGRTLPFSGVPSPLTQLRYKYFSTDSSSGRLLLVICQ